MFFVVLKMQISDLQELSINANYEGIREFYADDNQVTSITALEGSTFIDQFIILSLRSNNITSVSTLLIFIGGRKEFLKPVK